METRQFSFDVKRYGKLYSTSAGVGMVARIDTKERRRGRPLWFLIIPLLLLIGAAVGVPLGLMYGSGRVASMMVNGFGHGMAHVAKVLTNSIPAISAPVAPPPNPPKAVPDTSYRLPDPPRPARQAFSYAPPPVPNFYCTGSLWWVQTPPCVFLTARPRAVLKFCIGVQNQLRFRAWGLFLFLETSATAVPRPWHSIPLAPQIFVKHYGLAELMLGFPRQRYFSSRALKSPTRAWSSSDERLWHKSAFSSPKKKSKKCLTIGITFIRMQMWQTNRTSGFQPARSGRTDGLVCHIFSPPPIGYRLRWDHATGQSTKALTTLCK